VQEPLKVGDWSETHKVFDVPEVAQFAALSEDINPIHLDTGAHTSKIHRFVPYRLLSRSLR
jgi:acyl dehydratase